MKTKTKTKTQKELETKLYGYGQFLESAKAELRKTRKLANRLAADVQYLEDEIKSIKKQLNAIQN